MDAACCVSGEYEVTLPPLQGTYEVRARLEGARVPGEPVVKVFQREVYPWEHGGLGTSRTVYPPFTPITIDGQTLHTVLKAYDIDNNGLLTGVRTLDQQGIGEREILAAPMRLVAVVAGSEYPLTGEALTFTEIADDVVCAHSDSTLGPLPAQLATTLEYDGLLRYDLTLPVRAGGRGDVVNIGDPAAR